MKAALIVNPVAGQGRIERVLPEVQAKLKAAGFNLAVYLIEHEGQAVRFAREATKRGIQTVIVAGGDGTLSEVVNGVAGEKVRLGLIPAGTGDVFAHEMGIPTHQPFEACNIIIEGKTKQIDLGRADDRYFVLMAGIGFDAQVVRDVKPEVKKLLKDLAYPLAGVETLLTYQPVLLRVRIDDRFTRGSFVVVGNARYYGGRLKVTKEAQIDDGLLDVCVFTGKTMASFVQFVSAVITGLHLSLKEVEYYRAKEIDITSDEPVLVQTDGELIGRTPMKFSVVPKALTVLAP